MTDREKTQGGILEYLKEKTQGKDYEIESFIRPYGKNGGKIRGIKFIKSGLLKSEILIYKSNQITVNGQGVLMSKFGGFYRSEDELRSKFDNFFGDGN